MPLGCEGLEPPDSPDPGPRQRPELLGDLRMDRGDGVVIARLNPHHARLPCCAEPHREDRPEHDRNLSEDVPRVALSDDTLDPVDGLDRLDQSVEHGEERPVVARVGGVLAWREAEVGSHTGKPLAGVLVESREHRDRRDVIRCHHGPRIVSAFPRP